MTIAPGRTASRRRLLVVNPAADLYGSDRMLLEAAAGAVLHGWHVEAALGGDGPLADALTSSGVSVHRIVTPVLRKGDLTATGLLRVAHTHARATAPVGALVRRTRPDVVYINTVTMPWWLVMAQLHGVPSVVHVHEAEAALSAPLRAALTAPLRLADEVVFNSRTSRAVVGAALFGAGLRACPVVLNGVHGPPTGDVEEPRRALEGGPRLLYVGRLSPRKGVDIAVEAVRLLHKRGLPARLDIVGAVFSGYEWFEELLRETIAASGLEEAIILHGFRDDVSSLRAATDIALVPSLSDESFGNVVVESLLAQRPVVVADQHGLMEAGEDFRSVLSTRAGAADDVADAVAALVADWPRRRAWAIHDAERARRRHAPSRYHAEVVQLLEEMLTRSPRSAPVRALTRRATSRQN